MKKLALITVLLLAASPVAAQVVTRTTTGTSTGTNNEHLKRDNNGHLKRHNNRHLNWRDLCRGNGRDVLQRTHLPEHEWLWIDQRDRVECCVRIDQRDRVECRVRIEQRGWQQHVVHSDLPGFSAGERTLQLNQRARRAEMHGSPPSGSKPLAPQARTE